CGVGVDIGVRHRPNRHRISNRRHLVAKRADLSFVWRSSLRSRYAVHKSGWGEASVAYFAALIRDTKPRCSAVTQAGTPPVIFTVCATHVGQNTLDLGTILI